MKISSYDLTVNTGNSNRFVFVSDLHGYNNGKILFEIDNISPDCVLVGGDMVHNDKNYKDGIEFLRLCAEKYPTYCVIGNHEMKLSCDVEDMIRHSGAILLNDEFTEVGGIKIGGLKTGYRKGEKQGRTMHTPRPNVEWAEKFAGESGCKILLSHHPEYYPEYLKDLDIDLILSGHAHGGQWRIFGKGIFAPGQGFFPKYTSGLYHGRLLVSRGLSNNTLVPRIFNKRQIVIIELK